MRSLRAWGLRLLLGRLHVGEEIVRHLSTFQRLGATLDVAPPLEMLPVGARTIFRAVRTRAAADIRPDWLWPHWLERQLDPADPAFTPRGHLPVLQNVTHRNWTAVGNPGSAWEAIVDPTGLVTAAFDSWSLDWWVRAGGEWRFPSREADLQQSLVGAAPVVETALQTASGRVVQRVYTVETVPELVAVEVENAGFEPVEVRGPWCRTSSGATRRASSRRPRAARPACVTPPASPRQRSCSRPRRISGCGRRCHSAAGPRSAGGRCRGGGGCAIRSPSPGASRSRHRSRPTGASGWTGSCGSSCRTPGCNRRSTRIDRTARRPSPPHLR